MKTIAFFGGGSGVGKTTLVYHLGWRLADRGMRVLLVDLDPQSKLTAMCLEDDRLEQLWVNDSGARQSIRGAIEPIIDGVGDVVAAHQEPLSTRLALVPGDVRLSDFEQKLSDAWPRCTDRDPAAFRAVSSLHRLIQVTGSSHDAEIALIDVGPNVGAINRSSLIAADFVVTPLAADLFSIQGIENLGPTLNRWRQEWQERLGKNPVRGLPLPDGSIRPLGYVVMQPNLYGGQVTNANERWLHMIPTVYANSVLGAGPEGGQGRDKRIEDDAYCLSVLRHYRSLVPMAQSARKPIFKLTAADGAIGAHSQAVREVGREFGDLANKILSRIAYPP